MATLLRFMKKSVVFVLIIVGILIIFGALYITYLFMCEDDWCYHYEWQKERRANLLGSPVNSNEQVGGQEIIKIEKNTVPLESKPILYNLGVNIEPLNEQTNKAGDIIFTKELIYDDGRVAGDKAFVDFGTKEKYFEDSIGLIEYWFHLPLKTSVKSPLIGSVEVIYFEHTEDWGVNIYPLNSEYIVSFEHLVNLNVEDGETISVGQVIGQAAPRDTFGDKIAMVELAVWKGGSNILKFCPFDFLEESLKPSYSEKINALSTEWEYFIDKDVYEQEKWVSPGCLVHMIVEA